MSSNPRNHDHKKYSGPHGNCEGVKRGKYNCQLREHNRFGQNMSREKNKHSMESGMESIRKGYIYISALLFQIHKKKKKKWDSGTDTTLTSTCTTCEERGSGDSCHGRVIRNQQYLYP